MPPDESPIENLDLSHMEYVQDAECILNDDALGQKNSILKPIPAGARVGDDVPEAINRATPFSDEEVVSYFIQRLHSFKDAMELLSERNKEHAQALYQTMIYLAEKCLDNTDRKDRELLLDILECVYDRKNQFHALNTDQSNSFYDRINKSQLDKFTCPGHLQNGLFSNFDFWSFSCASLILIAFSLLLLLVLMPHLLPIALTVGFAIAAIGAIGCSVGMLQTTPPKMSTVLQNDVKAFTFYQPNCGGNRVEKVLDPEPSNTSAVPSI